MIGCAHRSLYSSGRKRLCARQKPGKPTRKPGARRYEQLFAVRSTSEEIVTTKRQELQIADAALSAAREDIARARSDREALVAQRSNLRLIAPVDGVVAVRDADPGTTIVAARPWWK